MKRSKKLLSLALAALMLISAIPFGAISVSAEAEVMSETVGQDYFYSFDFDHMATGTKNGNLSTFAGSDSNPYGFTLSDTGSFKGSVVEDPNGGKFYRANHAWLASESSGAWRGLRFTLNDGTTDHLITNAVETSFKFRWVGGGEVEPTLKMTFFKLRRHNGTDSSNKSTGRLEKHLLTALVDAETGEFVLSAYTHTAKVDGKNSDQYKEVYRFAKNSEKFSDISVVYYDAFATYSLYIDGKPIVEGVYIGYANTSSSIDVRDSEYVYTTYDGNFYATDRKPVSTLETWAVELFRTSKGSTTNGGFVFDVDSLMLKKHEASDDRIYYYKNSFDTQVNTDSSANAYNAMSNTATNGTYRYQGTAANVVLATETVDGKSNGYLDFGASSRLDLLDHYQLFQDGYWTVSYDLRATVSTTGAQRIMSFNDYGDQGTQIYLYLDSNGYLYVGSASNKSPIAKIPTIESGKWATLTVSGFVTNQNSDKTSFINGNPSNGRYGYIIWVDGELCGAFSASDGGPYRQKADGSRLINNRNYTRTELSAAPTADDLVGFTLCESESTDTFKVYKNVNGDIYQLEGSVSDGDFVFSKGVKITLGTLSSRFDSFSFLNKLASVSAEIDNLEIYKGLGPKIFAKGKEDTSGVLNAVKFAYLTNAIPSKLNNCSSGSATINTATGLGGEDGIMQAGAINSTYATAGDDNGTPYISLSGLTADAYYDLYATNSGGKTYSAKLTLRNLSAVTDIKLLALKRQQADSSPIRYFDTLFAEKGTGYLYFEHVDGRKCYLVDEHRHRYSVAGAEWVTPEIVFDESGDKLLLTFLVDGKVAYFDDGEKLVPAASQYIGGELVYALKDAPDQRIRLYSIPASTKDQTVDLLSASIEYVEDIPTAEEIKWEDSAYIDFSEYTSIEELSDQYEWSEGVTIEDGVLKIPAGGRFAWVDYNGVLTDYLRHSLGAVGSRYVNGFTVEMMMKTDLSDGAIIKLDRGSAVNDAFIHLSDGYLHMSGDVNSGYLMNTLDSDKYTNLALTITTQNGEANVFADGYMVGVASMTKFTQETADVSKIVISGASELSELRIHRDLERELATESGELFKLDANVFNPKLDENTSRWPSMGIIDSGLLSKNNITSRVLYENDETGESFYYFKVAPQGNITTHTHSDIFLNGYMEDKVTVFEYKFRFTAGTSNTQTELCYVRRSEENSSDPIWDWLCSISGAGNYNIIGNGKLCDEDGNLLVASNEDWNELAIIYDADAGLVSYRLNGKVPYCKKTNGQIVLAEAIQLPTPRNYRMDSYETQIRTVGMYAEADQVFDLASINIYTVEDSANAEYVGAQASKIGDDIRVVAGLDMLYYSNAGFIVEAYDADGNLLSDSAKTYTTDKVYSSIVENTDEGTRNIYPEDYGYRYFMTANITDIPVDEAVRLNVTPFTSVNGKEYLAATVTVDIDFAQVDGKKATTKTVKYLPTGDNVFANFSTTEVVAYTNDGALEFNALDAGFAFKANLEGGEVSVNLTNAYGEVSDKTVLDLYVDDVLISEGLELDFGRHTLVLAKDLEGEHTFKIVKRSGGDFVCINYMSLRGEIVENTQLLAEQGAVNVTVSSPAKNAEYGNVYVYVRTTDESGNYYIRYNFIYLDYGVDPAMVDSDNSSNPSYSSGKSNTAYNCHMYRVKEAFVYKQNADGSYTKQFNLLHQGEISVAIKEFLNGKFAVDFVGGYHGDENLVSLAFMVDGMPLDTTKSGVYNGVTTFELVQDTIINRCNEPDTPLLSHKQHFLVDTNGLRIDRSVKVLASDFSPTNSSAYIQMATVYRIGPDSKQNAEKVEETYNIQTMNLYNANGELSDDSSVFDLTNGSYPYISGSERSVNCGKDTNTVNRYAEYLGNKGVSGKVGFVIDDASVEPKAVDVSVRLTYGDNKWYASFGSYSVTTDEWEAANKSDATSADYKAIIVPKGEEWNISTYYYFDYNTANITE